MCVDQGGGKPKRVLVQVKSGHVNPGDIRDLVGTVQREQAAIGVFITLEPPSPLMITEALSAGYYSLPGWVKGKEFPRIQILSVADLLHGTTQLKIPSALHTFKQAPKVQQTTTQQAVLDVG